MFTPFIYFLFLVIWATSFFGAIVMAKTTKKNLFAIIVQGLMIATTFVLFCFVTFSGYSLAKLLLNFNYDVDGVIVILLS